jgi:hypothetical protein
VAASFSDLYAREHSGVVRIETVSCDASGIGTGFLLSSHLVATVAHVVDGAVVVSLGAGDQRTTGTVIGIDRSQDLALVRSDAALHGYNFHLNPALPRVGDAVGAIGFPVGDPMTLTEGHISGLQRQVTIDGTVRSGLVETDTAINPGNSGGPLIATDGSVVGFVDAQRVDANGIGYAVPSSIATLEDRQWARDPHPVPAASCQAPLGPGQVDSRVPAPSGIDSAAAAGIADALTRYFSGINSGNYAEAYDVLSARVRARVPLASFADGDSTSFDSDITVLAASRRNATTVRVALSFTSLQRADKSPGHSGDTCDHWTLWYTMVEQGDGKWYIDASAPYGPSEYRSC